MSHERKQKFAKNVDEIQKFIYTNKIDEIV